MLTPALLYLLKAHAALLLFAAVHYGLLRRLTFFTLNRGFLAGALLFAAVYPALPMPALFPDLGPAAAAGSALLPTAGPGGAAGAPAPAAGGWAAVALALYAAGTAVLLVRLVAQLLSLRRLRRASRPATVDGWPVRTLAGAVSPFSFGQTIYLNPARHPAPERAAVLRHEQVHVRQWHTLDVLLAQVAVAAAWCNPAAWLLARALRDNLEFLADRAVLQAGFDRRHYQYGLLRLSRGPGDPLRAGPALASHFTFLTLKTRVVMMNIPASPAAHKARYLLAGALALGLAAALNTAQAQEPAAPAAARQSARPGPSAYYIDGQRSDRAAADKLDPKRLASVHVLKDDAARRMFGNHGESVAVIVTTGNQNAPAVLALNEKIARVAPLVPGTETPADINVLTPAALAYLTKTYPNSRIIGVTKLSYPGTAQVRYKVALAEGRRPHAAFFNEKGQPLTM